MMKKMVKIPKVQMKLKSVLTFLESMFMYSDVDADIGFIFFQY